MDLLKALYLDDLPEQQTRTSSALTESQPDFQLKLGFDCCCSCGKASPKVACTVCRRVYYCSEKCLKADAVPPVDEEERALGHSSVLCALLCTCVDDEKIEEGKSADLKEEKRAAACDRVVSEFESYPATLSNVILEGPCYQEILKHSFGGDLEIHVVGASMDSELWQGHPNKSQEKNVFNCYAEALSEVAEKNKLRKIQLKFIGPECTDKISEQIPIPMLGKASATLRVLTKRAEYCKGLLRGNIKLNRPDIVVFFNPGFTCPDYSWDDALSAVEGGTPYLVTTNTELEGIADIQYLLDSSFIDERDIPVGLANILLDEEASAENDDTNDSFFSKNPFCGDRVRQSGTMANDLYVKSRWILGGRFSKLLDKDSSESNKKRKIKGSGNTKKKNPALV